MDEEKAQLGSILDNASTHRLTSVPPPSRLHGSTTICASMAVLALRFILLTTAVFALNALLPGRYELKNYILNILRPNPYKRCEVFLDRSSPEEVFNALPVPWLYHSVSHTTMPLGATELSFWLNGDSAGGRFNVSASESLEPGEASITVDMYFNSTRTFEESISIFFEVHVQLPVPKHPDVPYLMPPFETNLPLFDHTFDESLGGVVRFSNVNIALYSGSLAAQSTLVAKTVVVTGSNRPHSPVEGMNIISGYFNVSQTLDLNAGDGTITVRANLQPDSAEDATHPTTLVMSSRSGAIYGTIGLYAPFSPSSSGPGAFNVSASSAGMISPLRLTIVDHPAEAPLDLRASATGSIDVRLRSEFEGTFTAQAVGPGRTAQVSWGPNGMPDPTGQARARHVQTEWVDDGQVSGSIWWGDENQGRGNVALRSDTGFTRLYLDEWAF
ncbi:uncharacterized protein BXZ73DRAFT_100486 [Epithele typhae]|uniref:uncharacterized protein n=1 Tax=Epithele typhae TaxID=378194 RepID=UPI0020088C5E|nr:uncharacterized protein BXZ73DRAFT_100486 [Epithele typhae]KAH9935094.1 hypothetical protein BXZ73DRAFT_100486 [Epithele typhae]